MGRPLTSDERKYTLDLLDIYQNILKTIEPLRNYTTHNTILDTLKTITKNTNSNDNTSDVICTTLPTGTLKTYDDHNTCYPGIYVMFQPNNTDVEINICTIQMHQETENKDDKNIHVYTFGNTTTDDYTSKITIDTTAYTLEKTNSSN